MKIVMETPSYGGLAEIKKYKYEEKIVKVLLKRFCIPDMYKYEMLTESERRWGTKGLDLDLFLDFFPTFPVQLVPTSFPNITRKFTVADLFGRFDKTLLLRRYETCLREYRRRDRHRSLGMVFNWPHLKGGGGLVLHNHPIDVAVPGTRLFWVSERGEQVVLETLNVLLDTIDNEAPGGEGWKPELVGQEEADQRAELAPDVEGEAETETETADEYAACA
jgi:hypothetical protein